MIIIPSILVSTEHEFRRQITALDGLAPMVQIDIADGEFVPNTTWADPEIAKEILGNLGAELHIMAMRPLDTAARWKEVKQIKRCFVHYESVPKNHAHSSPDMHSVLREIAGFGWEVGLALNPETPIDSLEPFLSEIQAIQLMGIHPGFQGRPFISATLERVQQAKLKYPDKFIEVDGGVNEKTLPYIMNAGADAVTPGSAIFNNEKTPTENIHRLNLIIKACSNK